MIHNDIIIKLKGSSKKERKVLKEILLNNYIIFLDAIEKEADYCSLDAYWKDYTPISKSIITLKEFIKKHKNNSL